jgi:acetamidase/formamidase
MSEQYGMDRLEALGMASLVADLRITQIANEVLGVHALLPHGAIR